MIQECLNDLELWNSKDHCSWLLTLECLNDLELWHWNAIVTLNFHTGMWYCNWSLVQLYIFLHFLMIAYFIDMLEPWLVWPEFHLYTKFHALCYFITVWLSMYYFKAHDYVLDTVISFILLTHCCLISKNLYRLFGNF